MATRSRQLVKNPSWGRVYGQVSIFWVRGETVKVRHVDWYADEWIAGTIDLTLAERGMFITACSLIYSRGGAIMPGILRSFCHEDLRTYNRCLQRLIELGKIDVKDGYLSNKRCVSELERANKRTVSAVENGSKGGRHSSKTNGLAQAPGSEKSKLTTNYQLPTNQLEERKSPNGDSSENGQRRSSDIAGEMTKIWNEECGSISRANKPHASRVVKLVGRWRDSFEHDGNTFREFCRRIAAAPHLRGENDRVWKADLDWVMEPKNLARIVEGRYDPRAPLISISTPSGPPPIIEDEHGNRINPLDGSIVSDPGPLPNDTEAAAGQRIFSIH